MRRIVQIKSYRALLLAVMLALVISLFGACSEASTPTEPAGEETYTIILKSTSDQPFAKTDVFVYTDTTLTDLVAVVKTDEKGVAVFTAPTGTYAAVLKSVPAGYPVEASYTVTDQTTEIILEAKLIENPNLNQDKFRLHNVMFDFVVTDTENNQYRLSELLQQKKAVVLNFWFAQCGPCREEFPFLEEAFYKYSDDIALLALNPIDDAATVAQYRAAQGLTIPMASVDSEWMKALDMMYFPTTMIIDRYGNINMMYVGAVPNTELFENMFAYYTAEDYVQKIGLNADELPAQ